MRIVSYRAAVGDPVWERFLLEILLPEISPHLRFFLAMRPEAFAASEWHAQDPREWDWCWAFGPDLEFRWRADEGRVWAVVAWDGTLEFPQVLEAARAESGRPSVGRLLAEEILDAPSFIRGAQERRLRLWGNRERNGIAFQESRFPLDLLYPVQDGNRICLVVCEYLHGGEIAWVRAVSLEPCGN